MAFSILLIFLYGSDSQELRAIDKALATGQIDSDQHMNRVVSALNKYRQRVIGADECFAGQVGPSVGAMLSFLNSRDKKGGEKIFENCLAGSFYSTYLFGTVKGEILKPQADILE